ncbi:IclR family transcriptional regulator [Paenibacillus senegalensis]|uniref:IclR family transcriptional regulator n=1 Tax=Paenibacillus senegalensis TaxID=1465766 RepID=UPI00028924F9|nr:IclR family transcriptional regulator [Paenibacillus senegalensis]
MTDSSSKTKDAPYFMIQSVDRALTILQSFIEERRPMGVTEIAKRLGLHKSVVHRLMLTLQLHGYLEQVRDTEKYMIGPKAFELGSVYTGATSLIDEGKQMLMQVVEEIGMTAHLAILDGQTVLYLVNVEPDHFKYLFGAVGQRKQIYNTALGKSLTAWLPAEKTITLLADCSFEKKTSTTITSVDEYLQELARVRENGYALDNEESVVGMRCASAPVRDRMGEVIAAISVSGYNITYERITEVGLKMKGLAAQLSRRLGYYG